MLHKPTTTRIPLRDRINLSELETRLYDARRAIRIADHFSCETDGAELTAYAVQRAAHEIDAALAAFSGKAVA
ncbi:MAG: hypothetical protein ABS75_18535 [Pelagibacterium sp. SCN 63-23]|nr:MAG: hypothetical protein ABS75_18535 [Pelagibacterium sp. SCN 63-23]